MQFVSPYNHILFHLKSHSTLFFYLVPLIGGYDKEEKAARAYDLAALKYWGATTTTNFPVCICRMRFYFTEVHISLWPTNMYQMLYIS